MTVWPNLIIVQLGLNQPLSILVLITFVRLNYIVIVLYGPYLDLSPEGPRMQELSVSQVALY